MNIEKNSVVELDFLNSNIINIKSNARLIANIQNSDFSKYTFNLEDNAYLEINKIYRKKDINEEVEINLNGINSKVIYNFSVLAINDNKYIININHNNKATNSNVINHGVVINDSVLEFIVNSTVKKGNKKSILNQESKIITMANNNSTIRPNMYIDEYDVEAYHAASIGKFNKDDIFYLMTKGINKIEAQKLLIEGFLNNHI